MKMMLEEDPGLAARFLLEIRVHAALEHPNIAALRTALRAGPLAPPEAARIACQVLAQLDYAHAHGVVHRDIKPANILITPEGVAKLTDFGIARAADARRLTGTGAALGSLSYMAPEQIQGGPVDGRTDIYALGVTLYEAVSGRRPFQGENEYAIMSTHLAGDSAPPGARRGYPESAGPRAVGPQAPVRLSRPHRPGDRRPRRPPSSGPRARAPAPLSGSTKTPRFRRSLRG